MSKEKQARSTCKQYINDNYQPHLHRKSIYKRSKDLWGVTALLLGLSILACRIEISLGPEIIQQNEIVASKNETMPFIPQQSSKSLASLKPTPTSSPTSIPTPSPTFILTEGGRIKQRAETEKDSGNGASPDVFPLTSSTPSTPKPTPTFTPTPLIPARFPPNKIVIPAIDLDAPVAITSWTVTERDDSPISRWIVPDDAAGWHENSALPGHRSNIVLSGHHNIGTEVFRHIVDLQTGDEIILQADERDYHYTVTDRFILPEYGVPKKQRQQNAQWILPTSDERLTLITCWPYNDNSHRLIVVAKPS